MTETARSAGVRSFVRANAAHRCGSMPTGAFDDKPESRGGDPAPWSFDARLTAAKLEALAEFAAGAGHEINNPLATISGRAQMLLKDETDPERRQSLVTIGAQALRIRDMIGDLMLFARPPQPRLERVDARSAVDRAIAATAELAESRNCTVQLHVREDVVLRADPTQLNIVVTNLVRNAIEAQRHPAEIVVVLERLEPRPVPVALLSVTDPGPGFNESEREHLFDPFFSGRQAGRGLGFGLPKCWRIVTNHGGRIEVSTAPETGTTFRIFWPIESD